MEDMENNIYIGNSNRYEENMNNIMGGGISSLYDNNNILNVSIYGLKRMLNVHTDDYERIAEPDVWLNCLYVCSALFFIFSLKGLSTQESAKMGNLYGVIGMFVAIIGTVISPFVYGRGLWIFFIAAVPTGLFGCFMANYVSMIAIPQLVGLLNALGGIAATLESFALFFSPYEVAKQKAMYTIEHTSASRYVHFQTYQTVFYLIGAAVGSLTFSGSIIACGKLSNYISGKPRILPGRIIYMPLLIISIIGTAAIAGVWGLNDIPGGIICLSIMTVLSFIYGVLFVMAIGGADMPIVISVLNSGSGWSCVFAGFTLQNAIMVIAGAFVGASGVILSFVMCKAMNRSIYNVLVGGFGDKESTNTNQVKQYQGESTIYTIEDAVRALLNAKSVIIVPGYGMAVSRAQHDVAELAKILKKFNINVQFGVHPVAGRLPGHMNVLLAEANVPYDIVLSMDEINDDFQKTDVVIIIGANDTVNPAAEYDSQCAIYGMPVLKVWLAKTTIVLKRSMNVGYAGVDNPLFLNKNNAMLLGDAKKSVSSLVEELKKTFQTANGVKNLNYNSHNNNNNNVIIDVATIENQKFIEGKDKISVSENSTLSTSNQINVTYFNIGFLNETKQNNNINLHTEKRVAITPSIVSKFINNLHIGVYVEKDAGIKSNYTNEMYTESGGIVVDDRYSVYENCRIIVKINSFTEEEITKVVRLNMKELLLLSGFQSPSTTENVINKAAMNNNITLISLDILPRVTIAQKMDVLSTMAKLAGYRGAIESMYYYRCMLSADITAAGKYPPAKALIIGAGVAGLQAIGTLHSMGTDVRAFDVRLECKEQVESMGGKFLVMDFVNNDNNNKDNNEDNNNKDNNEDNNDEVQRKKGYAKPMSEEFLQKEMELFSQQCEECNIIITTAAIPGRRAPILLKKTHIDLMKAGSVIVDLAAGTGGNVELTKKNEIYIYNNKVTIIGKTDLTSHMGPQASEMFSNNIYNFVHHIGGGTNFNLDMNDSLLRSITLAHEGNKLYPPPKNENNKLSTNNSTTTDTKNNNNTDNNNNNNTKKNNDKKKNTSNKNNTLLNKLEYRYNNIISFFDIINIILVAMFTGLFAVTSPNSFPALLFIFVLSCCIGYLLVWNVHTALHTPLMSVTNAISGVVLVGGLLGLSDKAYEHFETLEECKYLSMYSQLSTHLFYCRDRGIASIILNALAVGAASVNVFGGFVVTQRMLNMFKKSNTREPSDITADKH